MNIQKFIYRFTEKNGREALSHPLLFEDKYIVASNGHIAIRLYSQLNIAASLGYPDWAKRIKDLIDSAKDPNATYHYIAPIELPELLKCTACDGLGYMRPCPNCNGTGFGDEWEIETCALCDGEQWIAAEKNDPNALECETCFGEEVALANPFQWIIINKIAFAQIYIEFLKHLPGAKININNPDYPNYAGRRPHYFQFENGDGVLMPMNSARI